MIKPYVTMLIILAGILTGAGATAATGKTIGPDGRTIRLTGSATQTQEFMGYYHSIKLAPEQERIKERALGSIPAPCCSSYSILTCCCPCNLAKAVWGLSNYAIAKLNYNEQELNGAVIAWLEQANPGGFTGNSCYTGGCERPIASNGCGGMSEGMLRVQAR